METGRLCGSLAGQLSGIKEVQPCVSTIEQSEKLESPRGRRLSSDPYIQAHTHACALSHEHSHTLSLHTCTTRPGEDLSALGSHVTLDKLDDLLEPHCLHLQNGTGRAPDSTVIGSASELLVTSQGPGTRWVCNNQHLSLSRCRSVHRPHAPALPGLLHPSDLDQRGHHKPHTASSKQSSRERTGHTGPCTSENSFDQIQLISEHGYRFSPASWSLPPGVRGAALRWGPCLLAFLQSVTLA